MDDVRVYNYALTPEKVKALYNSYPPEDTSIPAEIELDIDENKGIFVETNKNLKIISKFYRPSNKITLEVVLPSGLKQRGYEIVPLDS